jgi:hypothetical protein
MSNTPNRTRPPDWPQRLALFMYAKERLPFKWGANNCCLFTADWLIALTGDDLAAEFRGYKTALGAARALKKHGGVVALADVAFAERGWRVVPVKQARRGDVVAGETPHGPALGVCVGAESAFAGKYGIILRPTLASVRAWRVL